MAGQGAIIGAGAMEYPAEFQGASEERIAELGVGKLITLTSTYDHRIIQGAESGDFLRTIHQLLLSDDFWDEIFFDLGIPMSRCVWRTDNPDSIDDKNARVLELIAAYRNRGHLMADVDPLRLDKNRFRMHPDLDVLSHGLTLWDLDRVFKVDGFAGAQYKKLREVLSVLRDAYCRHVGVEYTTSSSPKQQQWLQERIEIPHDKADRRPAEVHPVQLNAAEAFETFLQTKYVGQKRFSLEGAESVIPMMDAVIDQAAEHGLDEVVIGMPHRAGSTCWRISSVSPIRRSSASSKATSTLAGARFRRREIPPRRHRHLHPDVRRGTTSRCRWWPTRHLEAVDPVLEGLVRAKQDLIDGLTPTAMPATSPWCH